ncbi:MAG TPA: selenocysteine-specific translation elongation factor [Thermoanaerobaculia bacterium]|nr:selenocysteine-specific translation elongation factor [Thermoanaerobaculia bacterium]
MKRRVIGTAGHIDHGKTSLVKALTGVDCDRLPEEKRRGITIDLGFASWVVNGLQIGFVDVPGHERFVKNMLAGAGGIDAVLLVVAADESVKPQTREHFAICKLLGVSAGLVAITKSDLVDPEILDLVRLEVEELVAGSFLERKPVVAVSSTTMNGLPELRAEIVAAVETVADRDSSTRLFRLPIDRVFSIKGFGTVVTGTTYSGSIAVDQDVEVLPDGLRSRARNVQVHGEAREAALAGERTSINLADLSVDSLHRGQQIVEPGTLRTSQILTVRLDLLPEVKPLRDQSRIRFHHLSSELLGSVRFVADGGTELRGGTSAYAQIRLESPVAAVAGDRFVIRRYSPATTIGGGVILDAHLPKLNRRTRPELLQVLENGSLAERIELMVKLAGVRGLSAGDLEARLGIRRAALGAHLSSPRLAGVGEGRWIHADALAEFRRRAIEFLDRYFKTNRIAVDVPKGEFVQKVFPEGADPALSSFLFADLEREKIAQLRGDALEIAGRSKTLGGAEGELARAIEGRFEAAALQPPPVSELIKTMPQKPKMIEGVISFLVKQGTLVRLAEGVYVHRAALADAREKMAAKKGATIDVGGFKDLFGLSRKIAIPLLEWMDREGITRRVGDSRTVL